jgi:endonuclease/exonuclease/phosphatase family metal-dependent hydrolase
VVSERSGLQPDDANSQEQYAYYLNSKTLNVIEDAGLFDDSSGDLFQREPYVARFGAINGDFTFVLITIHTRPESAVEEAMALHDAVEWAKEQFPDEDDFITLGDFNASCDFANPLDFVGSPILDNYVWIVPDDADTNVSTSSACAYDRIVITTETQEDFADNWGIDDSISSNAVSDHFPVWAEFKAVTAQ